MSDLHRYLTNLTQIWCDFNAILMQFKSNFYRIFCVKMTVDRWIDVSSFQWYAALRSRCTQFHTNQMDATPCCAPGRDLWVRASQRSPSWPSKTQILRKSGKIEKNRIQISIVFSIQIILLGKYKHDWMKIFDFSFKIVTLKAIF